MMVINTHFIPGKSLKMREVNGLIMVSPNGKNDFQLSYVWTFFLFKTM